MATTGWESWAVALLWIARLLTFLLVVASLTPFISSGQWWVRLFDFPRLQLAVIAILPFALILIQCWIDKWRTEHWFLSVLLLLVIGWQSLHVLPFSFVWEKALPDANSDEKAVRLLVANIKVENEAFTAVAESIRQHRPDLLLLIEVDEKWRNELESVRSVLPHRVEALADDGLGIALWSRLELKNSRIEYLVSKKRASVFATVVFEDGRSANFVGLHPTPPGLDDDTGDDRRDSRERDAELVLVARAIAEQDDEAWIVAGDFNDVAWSHTTRLFQRISGLLDPRVGRKLANTYHAEYPLFRYPIDHVFLTGGFAIQSLERAAIPGSDHFAVITDFILQNAEGATPTADGDDREEAGEMVEEGFEDARERGLTPAPGL